MEEFKASCAVVIQQLKALIITKTETEEHRQQAAILLSVVQEFSKCTFKEVGEVPVVQVTSDAVVDEVSPVVQVTSDAVVDEVSNETKS